AMLAHPQAEWIWWLDEDTVITDMEYKISFHKYKVYNFVVHGWPKEVYVKKRWLGLNDGSFLIRNCQWSLDMLDMWAGMGPRKILIETEYYLEGYWIGIVDRLQNITDRYLEINKSEGMLRRRHAEKVSEAYGVLREPFLK
nr:galactosyl transferase [Tanacetum cinerariifolium]